MAEAVCWCTSAISPGRISWMPANSELVMRDLPVSPGFSSTSTRRSASSALITSPASSISRLTSENFHSAGTQAVFGSGVTRSLSTSHRGAMWNLAALS